jgi:photosystem II stability/assembly factor-like uncharacterized protein
MNSNEPLNSDAPFDRELRSTLDAMAGEPAPERLVARVAEIPNEESVVPFRSRLRLSTPRLGPGFIGLVGAVVIALAVLVLRPAGEAPVGPGSSSIATLPSVSAPSTGIPSLAVGSPSAPAASPSSAQAPMGFEPVSVTFVSADEGWVLGSVSCGSTRCAAIERTGDGGRTWVPAPGPNSAVVSGLGVDTRATTGIARLRFATPSDGWAFGPDLWATHDGGVTWARVSVPGLPSGSAIVALEAAHGSVNAAFYDGAQHFRIATSPVGSDAWSLSPLQVAVGGGPVPEIQLVLSGDTGWLLENDRTVVGGARLVGGTWRTWKPACADVTGPAAIAASSSTDVVASCDMGLWSSPQGNHLFVSGDGGATFAETGSRVPVTLGGGVATPGTSTIIVSGTDSTESVLVGSFDGGQTWSTVLQAGSVGLADLGFTTPTQGVVVAIGTGAGRLLMTHDGGRTWSAIEF